MGTWIGHIAPGTFFIVFAFWWHANNCVRYIRASRTRVNEKCSREVIRFRGSTTYPCFCKGLQHVPVESIMKILITTIHFTIEIITGYNGGPRPYLGDENAHHTAMLFGFFLGSWIEILVHYGVPLPARINQVMGCLAFAIEGLMMVFHLHARNMVDGHIHQLLGLTMVCSMFAAMAECFDPDNFWFIVARSFFALTQGTWFIQAAFVIWPITTNPYFVWDPESHRSVSLLTMCYAYHLAGNAFLLIVEYLVVYRLVGSKQESKAFSSYEDGMLPNEYKLIIDHNDEES